jgi:hypothetical protein
VPLAGMKPMGTYARNNRATSNKLVHRSGRPNGSRRVLIGLCATMPDCAFARQWAKHRSPLNCPEQIVQAER